MSMVARWSGTKGVGRLLAEHVIEQARVSGYTAMQFNAVVETNTQAVAPGTRTTLWLRHLNDTSNPPAVRDFGAGRCGWRRRRTPWCGRGGWAGCG